MASVPLEREVQELNRRVRELEQLMRSVLRALSLMARGAEELEAWEEEEVRESLRDYLEGRLEEFESLSEVKRRVLGEA